jgi:SprT-like protein
MTQEELQKLVEQLSLKHFGKPFLHEAHLNNRLRTTGGRYHLNSHILDFNPKILTTFGREIFEGVIKHELCHYHLHLEGRGYRHGDADFKKLLKKVDGLRYTPSIEATQETVLRWAYHCQNCSAMIYRKRRFNEKKYVCAQCNGPFELAGRKEISL